MSLTDTLSDVGFGIGWGAVRHLPEPVVDRGFRAIADRTYRKEGPGVHQLRSNLARVLDAESRGALEDVTRDNLRLYMRYWSEVFRLPAWDGARMRESFTLRSGVDLLDEAVNSGRGAIMVASHSGNWDLAGAWACDRYGGITTVAEQLRPQALFDKFVAYRQSLGMEVLPLGSSDTLRTLVRRLREGRLVCLVADRDISGTGVPVDFFGDTASIPAGPATMSLMTGAPIMPVRLWHTADGLQARVDPALPIPTTGDRPERVLELTQTMADALADSIREHPADWHMLQRLWLSDPPTRVAS